MNPIEEKSPLFCYEKDIDNKRRYQEISWPPLRSPLKRVPLTFPILPPTTVAQGVHPFSSPDRRCIPQRMSQASDRPKKKPRTILSSDSPAYSSQLQGQVSFFESFLFKKPLEASYSFSLMGKIHDICNASNWDEDKKLAELGALYFYLTKSDKLDTCSSFIDERQREIEEEIVDLIRMHGTAGEAKKLPSGTTAYLLRCFVRMIITPDGTFNLGGCYSVIALLERRLCKWLSEEQRTQILTIVNLLIHDESLRTLFTTPFSIHPDRKELVHIDLKIPIDEPIEFIYVQWALLIAFFSVLGQIDEGNCFAVAPTMKFLQTHPGILLELVIQVLQKGSFTFEGIEVPVDPLLKTRRMNEQLFNIPLPRDIACKHLGIAIAEKALGVHSEVEIQVCSSREGLDL